MLIFTLYEEGGESKFKVHAIDNSSGSDEAVDVTTEYHVLPMRLADSENGMALNGFFFGHDSGDELLDDEGLEEDEEDEFEPLPGMDDINWED